MITNQKIQKQIKTLQNELKENNGVMPESWKPYAELLIIALKFLKVFTNDVTDKVIDEIIIAIRAGMEV